MAVMEVELPSGYNADVDALPAATRAKEVKRVDTANNDETVFVYFDRVIQASPLLFPLNPVINFFHPTSGNSGRTVHHRARPSNPPCGKQQASPCDHLRLL